MALPGQAAVNPPFGGGRSQTKDSTESGGSKMDLDKALRELYEERKRLDRAISRIESRLAVLSDQSKRSTRGRKSMGSEERLKVSARMTAYWAARRAQGQPAASPAREAPSDPAGNEASF